MLAERRRRRTPLDDAQGAALALGAALQAMHDEARPGSLRRALVPGLLAVVGALLERLQYLVARE